MRGKKIAAILLAGIIVINDCVTFLPALSQNVYAAGNYDSTNAQLYHETTVVSDYNDGSARWSYRLNKATKEGYVDNITDLKFKESVNGSTEITIPSTINGVAVTEIGKDAFANNTKLTAIKIPKTVTRICDKAFWGCKNLTTVSFEDANSVGVLGERAFSGCCKLTSIVLGADLMKDDTTGNYAFEDCESLENVVINNTQAVSIQEGTFDGCSKLKDVSLFTSSPAKSFHIGKYAFRNTLVETMNFNVPVTVDEGAFYGCKKLSSVYFKKSAIIGVSAFSNAFEKNSAIPEKKVTFYGVTNTLGESSFDGCTGITALEFSDNNSVINIGKNCFNGTSSLNEIEFKGKNVNTSIYAFNGMCASKVTFSNTERTEIAGDLFEKDNLYCNSICFNSKNVYLASYEQTANKVFSHAKKLKDVYFLNNVSTINATINGDIYFSNMYFYNPNISGIITDNSTVAYNVYGYWKKDDEDIKETLYKGTSSLRKYVDLQKALEVEYTGPSTILVGTLIDSSKIKVSNILFDDSKEAVTYSRDNTKYTGYVIEQNNLSNTGKQKIKVSYWNCSDAFDINVVTPTPLPTEKPIVTGVVEVSPTGKPGDKEGAVTGTPAVTQPVITITPTITPTKKITSTPAPVPTSKPSVSVTSKPSVTSTVTKKSDTEKSVTLTIKCANKKVKLYKKSSKTTYKVITANNIKIYPKAGKQVIYYQIVKKGKKLSNSKWKKAGKSITLKKQGRYCVYFKYSKQGKYEIVKTSGVLIDKSAPIVDVNSKTYKLKVKDTNSGIKYIKVNGKKVKSGYKLKRGINVIEAVDKAGNKKKVRCNIA